MTKTLLLTLGNKTLSNNYLPALPDIYRVGKPPPLREESFRFIGRGRDSDVLAKLLLPNDNTSRFYEALPSRGEIEKFPSNKRGSRSDKNLMAKGCGVFRV